MTEILSFITAPTFSGWWLVLKILIIVFALFFLGGVVLLLFITKWLRYLFFADAVEFLTYRPYGIRKIVKAWTRITARLETASEAEFKLAVIEADSMLDEILKRIGYSGETLVERLEKLTVATLPNIDQIREGHKIRNNIVHDPDFKLTLEEAKRVLGIYERALRDLQAL